jgi:hypothetical protein
VSHVVPKRKVASRLRLTTGEVIEGSVFLDFIDPIHRGEQTLLDKFNGESPWLPLLAADGVLIVNRDRITLVEPGAGVPAAMVRRENSPVFRRERVTLRTGDRTLAGQIAMDLPDEFSRVSDFLNFPDQFFAVETDGGPVLVSKRHAVALTPHERPPAPTRPGDEDRD